MKRATLFIAVVLLGVVGTITVMAKGLPSFVTVEGANLNAPITLEAQPVMELLNPWLGDFAQWDRPIEQAMLSVDDSYQINIYLELEDEVEPRLIYVFYYHPNWNGEHGMVYLPGQGEAWYTLNSSTIYMHEGGKWYTATPELDSALRPILTEAAPAPSIWQRLLLLLINLLR
ncbi:MAG: hypothetical protein D6712_17975 [Chloroflexi bacterium]|nr:MAG: hypothetical protein D6712_17975 [Chloroflexota bacterium]